MSFFKSLRSRRKDKGDERGPHGSASPSQFKYQPLDASKREIRVMTVNSWNAITQTYEHRPIEATDLHITLWTQSLDEKPKYLCLSYAWSKDKPKKKVYVDAGDWKKLQERKMQPPTGRQILEIPEDVCEFLRFKVNSAIFGRRDPNVGWAGAGALWIDQLCINQQDPKEAAVQIGYMDEIYFRPKRTLIWMGFGDVGLALTFVERIDWDFYPRLVKQAALPQSEWPMRDSLPPEHCPIEDPLNPRYWKALRALLERTWWSRTWIIQEALLSNISATMACGKSSSSLYRVAQLYAQFLTEHANHHLMPAYVRHVFRGIPFTEFLARYYALTKGFGQHQLVRDEKPENELTLLPLMSFASTAGVTKHQDRVYGLLGLCAKRYREGIHVDYEIPIPVAMTQAFKFLIKTAGVAALQLGKLVKGNNYELPTWFPDLGTSISSGKWFLEFPDRYYMGQSTIFHPWTADAKASDWTRLGVPDWELPSADPPPYNVGAKFSVDHRIMACRGISFDKVAKVTSAALFSTEEIDVAMRNVEDLVMDDTRRQRLKELEEFALSHDANPYQDKQFAFWRSLLLDRSADRRKLPPYNPKYLYKWGFYADTQSSNHMVERIAMNVNERTFFITTNGYFGIGPPLAREGDLVCVVLTAHVPFVLRPTSRREYEFVGDSYVHGISEGEIIPWAKVNGKSIEEIWLC